MTRTLPIWKVCKRARASGNGRHTQGVSFLPKVAHERVRGRASGRGLPALRFFSALPPRHLFNVWLQNWCKIQDFVYIHQQLDSHSPAIFSVASKAVNIQGYEYFSNEVYLKLFFFSIYFSSGCCQCIFLISKTCPLIHSCLVFVSLLMHCCWRLEVIVIDCVNLSYCQFRFLNL